jgi:hypothetical protein
MCTKCKKAQVKYLCNRIQILVVIYTLRNFGTTRLPLAVLIVGHCCPCARIGIRRMTLMLIWGNWFDNCRRAAKRAEVTRLTIRQKFVLPLFEDTFEGSFCWDSCKNSSSQGRLLVPHMYCTGYIYEANRALRATRLRSGHMHYCATLQ